MNCFKVFKTEVEARERCNSMATTPSTTPERKNPPKPPPPTFNALLAPLGQTITCTFCKQWRHGGLMVSVLVSGSRGPGSSPGRGHCVVFLGKTLNSHSASLHPGA